MGIGKTARKPRQYRLIRVKWLVNQWLGGMTVKVATARHISLHLGQTHCSCSDGCKRAFEKEPETYQEKVLTAWMR
jgi:YHS domain-containing protein